MRTTDKKVYVAIPHEKEWDIKIDTTKVWTIKETIAYGKVNDWCDHYIVVDEDGNEREIPEFEAVIAPDYGLPEDEMIYRYLRDNDVYADVYKSGEDIKVDISWGDWRHEHEWCRNLMEYINYLETDCVVTDEDGSDTYSATHTFQKFPTEFINFRNAVMEERIKNALGK